MAKKIILKLSATLPSPRKIEGKIVEYDKNGFLVMYKKPRKSKMSTEFFATEKIAIAEVQAFETGAEITLILRPEPISIKKMDLVGHRVNAPCDGFQTVTDGENILMVASEYATLEGLDEDEKSVSTTKQEKPTKKRGRPGRPVRKTKTNDDWEEEED